MRRHEIARAYPQAFVADKLQKAYAVAIYPLSTNGRTILENHKN